jgi:DNA polymerase-3 subunit alpha
MTPWTEGEMLGYEKELLGYYVSGHPLAEHAALIERYGLATTAQFAELVDRALTRVGGLISELDQKTTKKDQRPWAILKLEDLQGAVEVLVYPDTFEKYRAHIAKNKVVFIAGDVRAEERKKLVAREILPLERAEAELTKEVRLLLASGSVDPQKLERVSEILRKYTGKVPVLFCFRTAGGEQVYMDTHDHFHVRPDKQLVHELQELLGEDTVHLKVDRTVRVPQRNNYFSKPR